MNAPRISAVPSLKEVERDLAPAATRSRADSFDDELAALGDIFASSPEERHVATRVGHAADGTLPRRARFWTLHASHAIADDQLRHLSRSIRLEEARAPLATRLTVWLLSAVLLALLIWAFFVTVPEIASAPGAVAPRGTERDVQNAVGGTIVSLEITPGQVVAAGQVVARLDDAAQRLDLALLDDALEADMLLAERLRSFVEGREPDFASVAGAAPARVNEQRAALAAARRTLDDRLAVLDRQIVQRAQDVSALRAQLETARLRALESTTLLRRQEQLLAQGLIVASGVVSLRQATAAQNGEVAVLGERIAQGEEAITEFRLRRDAIASEEQSRATEELASVENRIAQFRRNRDDTARRMAEMEMRAPVRGVVKLADDLAAGDFLRPGQTLLKIVPLDVPLIVRARISPADIGRVAVGQDVNVKVDAYDFIRFGAVPGRVVAISPGSFTQEGSGQPYFATEIALMQEHVGPDQRRNRLVSGMTATVDIVSGERTVLAYLFKPLRAALGNALQEP